ncbi:hypothetical protein QCA50_013430 [Cerrena zonata]|uniref:Uncharacterized protein n=1 Tax=Cerrena zonata TaxID=2478898 RepID=A0AAW0G209_9APHY
MSKPDLHKNIQLVYKIHHWNISPYQTFCLSIHPSESIGVAINIILTAHKVFLQSRGIRDGSNSRIYVPMTLGVGQDGDLAESISGREPIELWKTIADVFGSDQLATNVVDFVLVPPEIEDDDLSVPETPETHFGSEVWGEEETTCSYESDAGCSEDIQPPLFVPGWDLLEDRSHWHQFYSYWRTLSFRQTFNREMIPLAFGVEGDRFGDPSFRLDYMSDTSHCFIVLKSYRTLYHRVVRLQRAMPTGGVVITGQPGIGKTTWLWFMLICFIAEGKVVAFYLDGTMYLFRHGHVYRALPNLGGTLSDFVESSQDTIWCLIGSDLQIIPPPAHLVSQGVSKIFPIQASPPDYRRYKEWIDRRGGIVLGMPLWTEEELMAGFRLQKLYTPLLYWLGGLPRGRDDDVISSTVSNWALNSKVTQPSTDLELNFRTSREIRSLVRELLHHVVVHYGNVPRDIYRVIFYRQLQDGNFQSALDDVKPGDFVKSLGSIIAFNKPIYDDTLIAITPIALGSELPLQNDTFVPIFKSLPTALRVLGHLGHLSNDDALLEQLEMLSVSQVLHPNSHSHPLSLNGILQIHAYRVLHGVTPTLLEMKGSPIPQASLLRSASFDWRLDKRKVTLVDFVNNKLVLPIVAVENQLENHLFVPRTIDSPLLDAFFVHFTGTRPGQILKATVWILNMTTSLSQLGTKDDHAQLRSIKAEVSRLRTQYAVRPRHGEEVDDEPDGEDDFPSDLVCLKYVIFHPFSRAQQAWEGLKGLLETVNGKMYCLSQPIDRR